MLFVDSIITLPFLDVESWISYVEPLGANISAGHLRFHPGYLQIPYLPIHAAIRRYHHNSAISWCRELKFCIVSPLGPKFLLSIQNIFQVICRYLICRFNNKPLNFLVPLTPKIINVLNFLPLGGQVPSGAYIARPLLSAWFYLPLIL